MWEVFAYHNSEALAGIFNAIAGTNLSEVGLRRPMTGVAHAWASRGTIPKSSSPGIRTSGAIWSAPSPACAGRCGPWSSTIVPSTNCPRPLARSGPGAGGRMRAEHGHDRPDAGHDGVERMGRVRFRQPAGAHIAVANGFDFL